MTTMLQTEPSTLLKINPLIEYISAKIPDLGAGDLMVRGTSATWSATINGEKRTICYLRLKGEAWEFSAGLGSWVDLVDDAQIEAMIQEKLANIAAGKAPAVSAKLSRQEARAKRDRKWARFAERMN